uniref:Uncharacterized protein n=1 Tax=Arundo donax TaxID=35708 RepID=A0A0A9HHZ5_ARUDO
MLSCDPWGQLGAYPYSSVSLIRTNSFPVHTCIRYNTPTLKLPLQENVPVLF